MSIAKIRPPPRYYWGWLVLQTGSLRLCNPGLEIGMTDSAAVERPKQQESNARKSVSPLSLAHLVH